MWSAPILGRALLSHLLRAEGVSARIEQSHQGYRKMGRRPIETMKQYLESVRTKAQDGRPGSCGGGKAAPAS